MITNLKNWLSSRARRRPATTIVLHATDGASASSSISWLRQIGLSYHFVIERNGDIAKCVPVGRVAFHAGESNGPDGVNVNAYSVGIAFANRESKGEKLTAAQIDACANLVHELSVKEPTIKHLTTHYAISPGRKTDPAMLSKDTIRAMASDSKLQAWGIKG